MKKTLIVVVALMTTVRLSAQQQYKLVRFRDSSGTEMTEFIWNTQHRMTATHTVYNGAENYEVYDSLTYDSAGNIIRLSGWQMMDEGLRNVYYIDYTYDASGHVTSRTNYNYFQNEWQLGGVYQYTYDASGFMTLCTLTMGGSVFQQVEYTNDANGIVSEVWSYANMSGTGFDLSEKLSYVKSGTLITNVYDSVWDDGAWVASASQVFTYDSLGNCLTHVSYDANGSVTERQIYTIDQRRVAECLVPWTPEQTRPEHLDANTNVYTKEEYWTLDANFVLQHMCDYTYEYIGINESGVEDVVAPRVVRDVRKIIIDGRLYIECGDMMYDMSGRRVR